MKFRAGTTIVAGEQDILLNSNQEFLYGALPSTLCQRGVGSVKIIMYCKKTCSYIAEQQLFSKEEILLGIETTSKIYPFSKIAVTLEPVMQFG